MAVKSAFRALEILEFLTRQARPMKFAEIQAALGYPKASLHGLLRTMSEARWLTFSETNKSYALGVRIWEGGVAYSAMAPLETRARPILERMRDLTSETVQLGVLDDFEVLYVAKVDGLHMLRLDSAVGQRLKPHATGVGKVLLASLPRELLERRVAAQPLERYTDNTITDPPKLFAELDLVRKQGYAIDREERTVGARCVAVGIRNHAGECVAAMSVSAPAVRFRGPQQKAALGHLRVAARELSAALGYPS
jgi:DNA-binding IclR family transcriptional regulator